jgi:hypothetical protein
MPAREVRAARVAPRLRSGQGMNHRPRLLGDLFHRIVWLLAVPAAGCGSSVTVLAGSDAGSDVATPTDRGSPVDAGVDAGPRVDTAVIDSGTPDVGTPDSGCTPRLNGEIPGTCEEAVLHPCGIPLAAQVDAGAYVPPDLCTTLCGPSRFGAGRSCRRLERQPDGTEVIACTTCAIGRRTAGLGPIEGAPDRGPLGDFFARVATLEWASVTAFERLADDLARLGAPAGLVADARRGADDERRHTRAMGALAGRYGAPVRAPEFTDVGIRSLEEIAVENAAEGCVRETFGALVATWQARSARDAAVAGALREVAADETRHAEFSWALQRWVDGALDGGARSRVRAARDAAAAALWRELDAPVDPALVAVAGLPDRDTGRALFEAMSAALA